MSARQLRQDFLRFAKLHSWYKHLPLEGMVFWASLQRGEQARNGVHSQINDANSDHWHFTAKKPEVGKSYRVRFGPFLRGLENNGSHALGFHTLISRAGPIMFDSWLAREYPRLAENGADWRHLSFCSNHHDVLFLFQSEQEKYWQELRAAVVGLNSEASTNSKQNAPSPTDILDKSGEGQ